MIYCRRDTVGDVVVLQKEKAKFLLKLLPGITHPRHCHFCDDIIGPLGAEFDLGAHPPLFHLGQNPQLRDRGAGFEN